jgi:hypothetical protein
MGTVTVATWLEDALRPSLAPLGWPHVFRGPVRRLFGIEQSLVGLSCDVP